MSMADEIAEQFATTQLLVMDLLTLMHRLDPEGYDAQIAAALEQAADPPENYEAAWARKALSRRLFLLRAARQPSD